MRYIALPLLLLTAACATGERSIASAPPAPQAGPTTVPSMPPSDFPEGQSVANPNERDFQVYLAALRPQALAQGIRPDTWDRATTGVTLNLKAIGYSSGESGGFGRISNTIAGLESDDVGPGRKAYAAHESELKRQAAKFGVDPLAVMGIWGNETSYGAVLGNFYVVEALASLAYEGRRRAFFENEFYAALKLYQEGDSRGALSGSYAGALGQVQFMPSNIIELGVDGDGDGVRDIRNSLPDAFASCAHFLAMHGWRSGEPWMAEGRLPAGFRWELAGPDMSQTAAEWDAMGVRTVDGRTLSSLVAPDEAVSIILPAGYRGIPLIAFQNYRRFLDYNPSQSYAISVSYLASRIGGGSPFRQSWQSDLVGMNRSQVLALQQGLVRAGYDVGKIDGGYGGNTRKAIRAYQLAHGLPADGFPTPALLAQLGGTT